MTVARMHLCTELWTAPIAVGDRPTLLNQFAAISNWRQGGFAPRTAVADFNGDAALTIDSPAGGDKGVELWGIVDGNIRLLAYIHAQPIVVAGANLGYVEELEDVAAATGLYVAGSVVGGNATVRFGPFETWGSL